MNKRLVLTAFLVSLAAVSYSQVNFSVKSGLCLARYIDEKSNTTDTKSGLVLGVNMDILLPGSKFSFSPSLLFISKGTKMSEEVSFTVNDGSEINTNSKLTITQNYLELPLTFKYRIPINCNINLTLGIGPYLAYGISGKTRESVTYSGMTASKKIDTFGKEIAMHRFDAGINYGVSLEYKRFIFSIDRDYGLASIHDDVKGEDWPKNESFALTLGYKL